MATWQRIGVAMAYTIGLMIGGVLYFQVFVDGLMPFVDPDGIFSTPVMLLENVVPIVLLSILLAVWIWVIAGAVQDEKRVTTRRVR